MDNRMTFSGHENTRTFIGFLAGMLTTASFIPQVLKAWKTRDTRSLSWVMYILFSIGVALWLWYGFMLASIPIILFNAITLILSLSILVLKAFYR
ncbi:MAG: SemiSWEET transporter [Leptospirales bacterium]